MGDIFPEIVGDQLHVIVWKSNNSCLAVNLAFTNKPLAIQWMGQRSKIDPSNVRIIPLTVVTSTILGYPEVPDNKEP